MASITSDLFSGQIMRNVLARIGFFAAVFLSVLPSSGADAPFAGQFSDGHLTLDLKGSGASYSGTITLGNQQFPADGQVDASKLDGAFVTSTGHFTFTASLDGDTLTLLTGNATYTLKHVASSANPLAAGAPPANPSPVSSDAPSGYTLEASTDSGKSFATKKPDINKLNDALIATFSDLATYFGNRPTLGSAFQDAKDPTVGNATFSAVYHGQAVSGVVSCKMQDGAAISVIFLRADAPKGEWETLMAHTAAAAIPSVPLKECDYVDGTGSIGLADGWTAQAPSAVNPFAITGPANQSIGLHSMTNISTPDSPAAQQYQKHLQLMAQHLSPGNPMSIYAIPTQPVLIAPLTDPATALPTLLPQFSALSEFHHGPSLALDKIIASQDIVSASPSVKGAVITFDFTQTLRGQSTAYRERAYVTTSPLSPGVWVWNCSWDVHAPIATFDQDLPVMMATVNSQKGNPQRIQQVVDAIVQQRYASIHANLVAAGQAQQQSFEQSQRDQQSRQQIHDAQMAQTQAGYDQINQNFNDHELDRSRGDADRVEAILGTRTVYDTVTGESGYADLTDVTGVVNSLNQAALDPNRFIQIPLRDQLYPLPGK